MNYMVDDVHNLGDRLAQKAAEAAEEGMAPRPGGEMSELPAPSPPPAGDAAGPSTRV